MKPLQSHELKLAYKELKKINALSSKVEKLSDDKLKAKTTEFKNRLAKGETIESIRVEVFAVAREAAFRVLKQKPYDVQMLGGLILTMGSVAEMKTGEGKTLTSIAPVYLYALAGKGVIVSTVNEYLTQRDAEEMGKVHEFLGLTVGVNLTSLSSTKKREMYACDITYSVHSEIGFDYLRDNMAQTMEEKVQRGFFFALIDEVDSILIDEARTPLIISGGSTTPIHAYVQADMFTKSLSKNSYEIDWESKTINLTSLGMDAANTFFRTKNIFDVANSELVHRIFNALRANFLMFKDADYIVRNNEIVIVDSFTGRVMDGRSFSDGLHQAIQAKERVEISPENTTLATITYQNLFRMFTKLAGMSGTAKTEEDEFIEIYNMRVHVIPTNKPIARIDHQDEIYVTQAAKQKAIVELIKTVNGRKQPILLGTEEVSESETFSDLLRKEGIRHVVLNAKQNEAEADTIARAGEPGAVTIATNMAGRGTDIKLKKESLEAGGLYVIGTNKAEARRIDNQLKGRAGRQGDPGESKFILSLDDKLIARFSSQEKLKKTFSSFGEKPISGKQMVRALRRAQVRIEGFNFDARKNVLQYDDVIRQQRDLIYAQRDIIIGQQDLKIVIDRMIKSVVKDLISQPQFIQFRKQDGTIDPVKLASILNNLWFMFTEYKLQPEELNHKSNDELIQIISKDATEVYEELREIIEENIGLEGLLSSERSIILSTFDKNWQVHIDKMQRLKSATNLSSYAQKNPFQVYVEKGSEHFKELLSRISHNTIRLLFANYYARKKVSAEDAALKAVISHVAKETAAKRKPKDSDDTKKESANNVVDETKNEDKKITKKKPKKITPKKP